MDRRPVGGWTRGGAAMVAAVAMLGAADVVAGGQVRVMTDRPDRANSMDTIPPGMAQIESGIAFLRDASGERPVRRSKTETSLRLGVAEPFEVDLVTDGFVRERAEGGGTSGLGDTTLAAKWRLLDADGWRPALGLLPFVKLPTASASKGLGSGRVDFGGQGAAGQDLPLDLHVDVNVGLAGISLAERPGGLFLQKSAAASFSWTAMDWVYPFWEVFYDSRERPAGRHSVGTDFGLVFTLHDRVAVDVAGQVGLAGNAPDWAVRAGFTLLLGSLAEGTGASSARRSPAARRAATAFDTGAGRAYYPGMVSISGEGVRP